MEIKKHFKRKIIIITGAACELGFALTSMFIQDGARVMIVDRNESILNDIARVTGAIPLVSDFLDKNQLRLVVNKAICRFGKIDLFISHTAITDSEQILLSEKENSILWHKNIIAQMYAAMCCLPFMIKRGMGHFVNTIPACGLMKEFHLPYYSTTNHPALSFAERLRSNYEKAGIKVSVICIIGSNSVESSFSELAATIIEAVKKGEFRITPSEKICKQRLKSRRTTTELRNRKINTAA